MNLLTGWTDNVDAKFEMIPYQEKFSCCLVLEAREYPANLVELRYSAVCNSRFDLQYKVLTFQIKKILNHNSPIHIGRNRLLCTLIL